MTPALIGRDHPAGVLRAEIGRATDSHGGLVLVTGEAGIGKTTLVTDAADEARRRGALVLGGSCWDSESAPGYWPWVQVVRGLRRGVDEDEWAEAEKAAGGRLAVLLGEAPGEAESGGESFLLYDAVTTALVTVSQKRPLVVVLDDLHWADPASLKLLEFAAQHAWFERLLLIGTYRDVEVESADHPLQQLILPLAARAATTVTLTGLQRDEVGALIALTAGVEPEDSLVDEVHRRTGGNPFFVEQTARIWHSGSPVTTVAPGVREAVRRRLGMLPAPVGALLVTAAVLGREFHRQVLAAAASAPVPHVDRLLARAVAARLVIARTGGRFAFAHDLVRETLYEALGEPETRTRHAGVVRALDGSPALSEKVFPADLARHAYLAGEGLERDRRVELLLAAARDASSRLAREEAVGHYRRALETAGDDARRAALIALDLGGELRHGGEDDEGWRCFERAVALARELREPELLARVAITLHQNGYPPDRRTQAAGLLREAHRALIGGSEEDLAELGPERIAQELAVRTTALARRGEDDEALAFSLWARHDSIWGLGSSTERLALTDEMAAVARRTHNRDMELHATAMRWVTLLERGDPRYLDQLRTFITLSERMALRRFELGMAVDQSLIAALHGRFREAGDFLSQVAGLQHEHAVFTSMASHMQWALFLLQGRFEEAAAVTAHLDEDGHPYPRLLEAITAAERGESAVALRLVTELEAQPEPFPRMFAPLWMRLRAQVAAASGDLERIEQARAALEPYSGQWVVSLYGCDISGPVDLWLGMLDAARGRWDEAAAAFTAAYASADRLCARPWSVRARAALVAALREGGAQAQAAELLARTRVEARELGLTHLLEGAGTGAGGASERGGEPTAGGAGRVAESTTGAATDAAPGAATGAGDGAAGAGSVPAEVGTPRHPGAAESPAAGHATGAGAHSPHHDVQHPPVPQGEFRRDGAVWALGFGGRAVHVPDAKGLRDLHTLLARPGDDLPAVLLLDPEGGEAVAAARRFGGDPVLDEEAKSRYRRRLERLDDEIDRASELGDDRRAAEFDRERSALLDELRTAAGLGGRTRRLGDEAERARKTVTARIRDTLRKLDALHPELAAHLRESVGTGSSCSYRPPLTVDWRL
ncbi:AAA family ATPase [Streptomyces sp. NBC_01142]|uniref:ATP-binding protein n=1 Tax=Streptomyces sp. NBC_01142 TaxID=2975865 RepID=UPI002257A8A1|nr:AAA family ATPase [Streptomyces sp. NBC_01142]MCX4824503.1 AAA family ATPase [Streptomyces sp. NBC_01142]